MPSRARRLARLVFWDSVDNEVGELIDAAGGGGRREYSPQVLRSVGPPLSCLSDLIEGFSRIYFYLRHKKPPAMPAPSTKRHPTLEWVLAHQQVVYWLSLSTCLGVVCIVAPLLIFQNPSGQSKTTSRSRAIVISVPPLTPESSYAWAHGQLKGRSLASQDAGLVLEALLGRGATAFGVSEVEFEQALKNGISKSLATSAADQLYPLDSRSITIFRWCCRVWDDTPPAVRPSTPVDLLIFLLVGAKTGLDVDVIRSRYYDGYLEDRNFKDPPSRDLLDTSIRHKPIDVYRWCQREWEIAEIRGQPISERDDTIYHLAAKHFGITSQQAEALYMQGALDAYNLDPP